MCSAVVILIIWVGNVEGPDISNYLNNYDKAEIIFMNKGFYQCIYQGIMALCHLCGLSFMQFRFVVTFPALLLMYNSLKKYSVNLHGVIMIYLAYIFFLDGVQIRNFLGYTVFFNSLHILYNRKNYWRIEYIISIFVAGLIHSSFWVYIIFALIPVNVKNKKSFMFIHVCMGVMITFLCINFQRILIPIINILGSVDSTRTTGYTVASTKFGSLISMIMQIFATYIVLFSYKVVENNNNFLFLNNKIKKDKKIIETVVWINILELYLLPFCVLQITFYRLVRNLFLINTICFMISFKYYNANYKYIKYITLGGVYFILWFIIEFYVLGTVDGIITPLFESNYFLEAKG